MNVELVAQMFKNYQSNVLFHLEGSKVLLPRKNPHKLTGSIATDNLGNPS